MTTQIRKLSIASEVHLDVVSSQNLLAALFSTMNLNSLLLNLDGVDGNAFTILPDLAAKCEVRIMIILCPNDSLRI